MGTDDLFKKHRAERQKRKHEFKSVNTNSFLIVTEGEKTEPLYFKGLQKKINEKVNGRIDIVESPVIDIFGQGCSTSRLIEATEEIVKDSKVFFIRIYGWFLIKTILKILMRQSGWEKKRDIKLPGAISHSNIGFIYISIMRILRFIGMIGVKNSMRYSSNIIWGMEPTIKIVKRFSI